MKVMSEELKIYTYSSFIIIPYRIEEEATKIVLEKPGTTNRKLTRKLTSP